MHQDKKRAELEEEREWQREKMFEKEQSEFLQAEIVEEEIEFAVVETSEEISKRKNREVIFEMVLFLILGVLLGITMKTEAVKRITIGFNDYQVKSQGEVLDIEDMKKNLDEKLKQQEAQMQLQQQIQQASGVDQAEVDQVK